MRRSVYLRLHVCLTARMYLAPESGSPPNFGDGVGLIGFLAALSNNAKAVVGEVFKAVSSALNEFHFAMEAFGNAVVFGKAPHGCQGFSPAR